MSFLYNTDIVVAIGFALFIGILVYFGAPRLILAKLDERAERIRRDLDEARALREEAQSLLVSYERKQKDVSAQADDIVSAARAEAEKAAEKAKEEIRRTVARRLRTATDQIAAAEKAAIRQIKDRAVGVAVSAAGEVLRRELQPADADALIDRAIADVGARIH